MNVATARGVTISGEDVTSNDDDAVTVLCAPAPTVDSEISADDSGDSNGNNDDATADATTPSEEEDSDTSEVAADIVSTGVERSTLSIVCISIIAAVVGSITTYRIIRKR